MSRQQALITIWQRLLIVLGISLTVCVAVLLAGEIVGVATLVFLVGNIGGYISVHRGLGDLSDNEVTGLAASWWAIVVPPFVGGVLALAMYILFLSNILAGDLFPAFRPDPSSPEGFKSLLTQHADGMPAYAKLLFWSFVAGFNQKYVVDIINSVKAKPASA